MSVNNYYNTHYQANTRTPYPDVPPTEEDHTNITSSSQDTRAPNRALGVATGAIIGTGAFIALHTYISYKIGEDMSELISKKNIGLIGASCGSLLAIGGKKTKAFIIASGTLVGSFLGLAAEAARHMGGITPPSPAYVSSELKKYVILGALAGGSILTGISVGTQKVCGAAQKAWRLLRG